MITGFNTDIKHNNKVYHVQTEDKGRNNPCIESLVYVGGEILASKKTSYAERLTEGADEKTIAQLMELQHKTIIAAIKRGRFDKGGEATAERARTVTQTAEAPVPIDEEKTLDQVILDYLAAEAENEHLELSLLAPVDFVAGQTFEFRVNALKSHSQQPIVGATIEVKVISTVEPPRIIFRGTTDTEGGALVRSAVPMFHEGTAAVIVSAQSELGNDELKQLVKRRK